MSWIRFLVLSVCAVAPSAAIALDYKIERIASGLSQPNYVTQAAGDPSNILYYTERASGAVAGFNPVNHMGRVMRYDTTQSATPGYVGTPIIDLSGRNIINDDGLEGVAFSPDFQNTGAPGFGKIYVSSSQYNGSGTVPTNRVEEYTTTNPSNPTTANTTLTRTILQYNNNSQNNHTIDWLGFDPTATGEARNFLYISTGNASFGLPYNNATSPGGMPSQNPSDVRGKILRVDVNSTLPNSYQGVDSSKNFNIPASNPIPTYLSAHPSTLRGPGNTAPLGEVYVTGMRNAYRVSFDRANGNMYMGDVGETTVEEVDFLKAGTNNGSNPPVDFGWPQREGTTASNTDPMDASLGYPTSTVNPFTGVTQLNPIQQFLHNGVGKAVIGGYVYRGPVASLQGQYFYSDFVQGTVNSLDFDPVTNPSTFNGNNGTLTDDTSRFKSLLGNPAGGLGHIVSYGEDQSGNLFIVDFGGNAGDSGFGNSTGEYPTAGLGQIFEIVRVPEPATIALAIAGVPLLLLRRCRLGSKRRSGGIMIGFLLALTLGFSGAPTGHFTRFQTSLNELSIPCCVSLSSSTLIVK
jgi:glucose/arabinose dehydrogenase